MSSKEDGIVTFLGSLLGALISPLTLIVTVPVIAWWAFWGAKISVALTTAFGWPLLTFTQIACLYLVARFFWNDYPNKEEIKDHWHAIMYPIITPAILWLTAIAFIWLCL